MSLEVLETRIGELVLKSKILSDSDAWLKAMTPELTNVILKRWIQQDQLFSRGVDQYDNIIGLYSMTTEKISRGRKKAGDPFTLYDTGAFYRSMFVSVLRDGLLIDADSHTADLMRDKEWWNEQILGLDDSNLQKLIEATKIKYRQYILKTLRIN